MVLNFEEPNHLRGIVHQVEIDQKQPQFPEMLRLLGQIGHRVLEIFCCFVAVIRIQLQTGELSREAAVFWELPPPLQHQLLPLPAAAYCVREPVGPPETIRRPSCAALIGFGHEGLLGLIEYAELPKITSGRDRASAVRPAALSMSSTILSPIPGDRNCTRSRIAYSKLIPTFAGASSAAIL